MADMRLHQVQVITRHGAQLPTTRDRDTLEEHGGAVTHSGQKQLHDLGVWLRNRYPDLIGEYDRQRNRFESSAFDRTIVSANALAAGLYPASARDPTGGLLPEFPFPVNVPVFTEASVDDVQLRAYDKCPVFTQRLRDLYQSNTWTQYQQDTAPLLAALADVPDFASYVENGLVPLKHTWVVWDIIREAKELCDRAPGSANCNALPNPDIRDVLDDVQFAELTVMVRWAEFEKYSWQVAGRRIGGNVLHMILQRMAGAIVDVGAAADAYELRHFNHYSSHFPTLMGVIGALTQQPLSLPTIPDYGAAIIFELYKDTQTSGHGEVQIIYKGGHDIDAINMTISRICNSPRCSFADFQQAIPTSTYESFGDWCDDCDNRDASVCLVKQLEEVLLATNPPTELDDFQTQAPVINEPPEEVVVREDVVCADNVGPALAGGFAAGVAFTAVVMGAVFFIKCSQQPHPTEVSMMSNPQEQSTTSMRSSKLSVPEGDAFRDITDMREAAKRFESGGSFT